MIPVTSPNNLDHIPAHTTEIGFELLNHLAITTHRAIEALKIAVDHENKIVELLASGQRNRPERFWLVTFAIAKKGPNLLI